MNFTIKIIGPESWGDVLLGALITGAWVGLLYGLYGVALLWRGWRERRSNRRTLRRIQQTWPLPALKWE